MRRVACGMANIAESAPRMSQQVRAVPGDPRRGVNPVELIRCQSFGDFPCVKHSKPGCRGQIG